MSEIKKLANQSSHYFYARILTSAAGFISFPILTRIFSVGDYGLLGLLNTTMFILFVFSKFGLPNTIVRFFAEFESSNRLTSFYSTIFLGSIAISFFTALLFFLIAIFLQGSLIDKNIVDILILISLIVIIVSVNQTLSTFLRAEQRTKLLNFIGVIIRYASLALAIFFSLFFIKGLYGYFCGLVIAGFLNFFVLLYVQGRKMKVRLKSFSPAFLKDSIKFSFPLIWAEASHLILNYADRYLIKIYLNSISLGLYTAGYNLAMYATDFIVTPITYAITPIYMKIFIEKGEEQTKIFFTKLFRYFLLLLFPMTFGFISIGKNLVAILASSKYIDSSAVIPYVIIGQAIYACQHILNCGLFIKKKTYIVTIIMICACCLNFVLNIIMIPLYGIIGAAQATLITYILYTVAICYYSFKHFSFPIDYRHIFFYFIATMIMFLLISKIDIGSHFLNLCAKLLLGVLVYCSLILLFDEEIRLHFKNFLKFRKYQ